MIVRHKKKGTRQFCRADPAEPSVLVLPLCGRGKPTQYLKGNENLGPLFRFEVEVQWVDHAEDFCQRCKAEFRKLHGLDIVGPFSTCCSKEPYPGQPIEDRFMLFASTSREIGSEASVP